jgi:hypothetical protein
VLFTEEGLAESKQLFEEMFRASSNSEYFPRTYPQMNADSALGRGLWARGLIGRRHKVSRGASIL